MSIDESILLGGTALLAISGVPGLLFSRQSLVGQWITTAIAAVGAGGGLVGAFLAMRHPTLTTWALPSPFPGVAFELACDALSAVFLAPIFLVSLLGSVFGISYWKQTEHTDNGRKLRLFYGWLTAALAVLVLARNSVTFLFGWEIMAVSAFFLVSTEDQDADVRRAGWLYLAASHAATLGLFGMFALLYGVTGDFALRPLAAGALTPVAATAIFILALAGFGLKAGIMPLHFWLPSAHAMAPSHVSALMSGVLIKTGIYGLVRITSILPEPPLWWGGALLVLGTISAVLGVAFALGQHDIKRLLAYHSIENIGIIVIGLALALIGRTLHKESWIVLGMAGCLLHVWNHGLFKSLLFLSAGSVIHACGTREIDHLGGLAKTMPQTAACFLIGAAAICGLPPLNGFISEFLIYSGLFQTIGLGGDEGFAAASFAIPVLALMGALAVACFAKVFGVVFLGTSRSADLHPAHESPLTMVAPLWVLAAGCAIIGIVPPLVVPVLDRATAVWSNKLMISGSLVQHAPLVQLSLTAVILCGLVAAGAALLRWRLKSMPVSWVETWGCGYAAPTPRMQYTASSFAQFLVDLLAWALRPIVHRPHLKERFPAASRFSSHVPEVVLDYAVMPVCHALANVLVWFRVLHQGSVQLYLFYVLAMLVVLLLF